MSKNKSTYQRHGIDKVITNFIHSIDKGNFGNKEKIIFFKQLSYLLNGGVSISESMKIIDTSSDDYAIKEIARNINGFLIKGKELSYALSRLPDYFDEKDFNIVKAGEKSGSLTTVLKSLAEEYSYINEIKNKYIIALTYPGILIIITIISVIALFAFVLPGIFEIADSFNMANLPTITVVLKNMADYAKVNRIKIIWALIGVISFILMFISTDYGKKIRFGILLKIPIFGKITKYYYLVKRCRYTKIMLDSGMNYIETFQLLRNILNIPIYQNMIEKTLSGLQKGETIYETLKSQTYIIPPNVSSLIRVGEETASLENSLENILNINEEELNSIIERLSKIIEPVILVVIGVIIVIIALGVFGLILNIMESVGTA